MLENKQDPKASLAEPTAGRKLARLLEIDDVEESLADQIKRFDKEAFKDRQRQSDRWKRQELEAAEQENRRLTRAAEQAEEWHAKEVRRLTKGLEKAERRASARSQRTEDQVSARVVAALEVIAGALASAADVLERSVPPKRKRSPAKRSAGGAPR